MAAGAMLALSISGCVTHVVKDNSVSAQLRRATGNGQGWYVTTNSNSQNSSNGQAGFTPHQPGHFIYDPSEPSQ
jgi:hypothetical protein